MSVADPSRGAGHPRAWYGNARSRATIASSNGLTIRSHAQRTRQLPWPGGRCGCWGDDDRGPVAAHRRTGQGATEVCGYGLVYAAGRSHANYRLSGEPALWCVQVITGLRALGLTVAEISQLAGVYLRSPGQPIGPHLAGQLRDVRARLGDASPGCRSCGGASMPSSSPARRNWPGTVSARKTRRHWPLAVDSPPGGRP
jgi:hypothetical protein